MRKRTVSLYDLCKENQFRDGYEWEEDDPPKWYREIMVSMRWPNDKEIERLERKYDALESLEEARRKEKARIEWKKEHERFLAMSIEEKVSYLILAKKINDHLRMIERMFLAPYEGPHVKRPSTPNPPENKTPDEPRAQPFVIWENCQNALEQISHYEMAKSEAGKE